jgi:site-specific DNA-cytosine methylase
MDELKFNEDVGLRVVKPDNTVRPFDYLDVNLIETANADEREYYSTADGMFEEQRVKTRNFIRSKYGASYRAEGQDMTDQEVDSYIRTSWGIDSEQDIDYFAINEDLKAQDQHYTGDFEDFTHGERAAGFVAAFAQLIEFIGAEINSYKTIPEGIGETYTPEGGFDKDALRKLMIESQSAVDENSKILSQEMRDNLTELYVSAADENPLNFVAAFDAFLANTPNLVLGTLPPVIGMPLMMAIEKRAELPNFEKLFGVPSVIGKDNPNIEVLNQKRQEAELFASAYGIASGIVEYYQNRVIGRIGGQYVKKKQRELINTLGGHLKKIGILTAENIGEELVQQGAYNFIYNLAVDYSNEKYGTTAKKVKITEGMGESALMAGRISFISAFPGTLRRSFATKNFINSNTERLLEFGFDEARAKEYARDLANAASNREEYEAVTERIRLDTEQIDLAKAARIEVEKSQRMHDETGLITANGEILTNNDFDRLAIQYNAKELSNLIADPEAAPIFVNAVYGDMEARKNYNDIIIGYESEKMVEDSAPEDEPENELGVVAEVDESDETLDSTRPINEQYELPDNLQEFVQQVLDGQHDEKITLEEGESIEDGRKRSVEEIYKERGTKIDKDATEESETKEELSWEEIKQYAKDIGGIKLSGKGRTKAVIRAEVEADIAKFGKQREAKAKATEFTSENPRANEQSQRLIDILKSVVPNINVKFAANDQNFKEITGNIARAFYDMDGTIVVNPKRANAGSLAHESTHAIFHSRLKSDAAIRYAAARILDDMLGSARLTPQARARMTKFRSLYIRNDQLVDLKEEQLAEFAAMMREGMPVFERSLKSRIQDFLARIFKGFINVSDEARAIQLLEVIAGKVERGETIFKEDVSLLDEILSEYDSIPGYESEGETQYPASKFQQSYTDPDTGMTFSYDIDREQFKQLEEDGYITRDFSLRDFNDKFMLVHQPDGAFAGTIERNGVVLVRGKGGVNFPLLYNELGYLWAGSGKDGNDTLMQGFVKNLNSMIEANGGTILIGLSSAPRGKELASTIGSSSVLDTLQNLVNDPSFPLTQEQLNKALIDATSRKYMGKGKTVKPKDFLNINTTDQNVIKKILGAFESNFQERSNFAIGLINSLADQAETNPKLQKALLDLYNSIKYEQPEKLKKPENAKSLKVKGKAFFSEFQTEPLLKNSIPGEPSINRTEGGQIYAVLEINGPVELLKTPESFNAHESYPFVVASVNGSRPVVHILKDRYNKIDGFSDVQKQKDGSYISTGETIPVDRKKKVFPEQAGVSVAPLRVMVKGKQQLSSDYMLNFDRIPQVVEAIKRYFAGEITYEQFVEIQQKFDPIRRFDILPELPNAKQMKDVLEEPKRALVNKRPKEGDKVKLRLDIPAYKKKDKQGNRVGKYVVTIHSAKDFKPISYQATARAKNVEMVSPAIVSAKIAIGIKNKDSISTMRGEYIDSTDQENYELGQQLMNDPDWTQIGFNPFRRSFFYVREGEKVGMPVLSADEVVQIGGLVFAKNPEIVTLDHPNFRLQKQAQKEALGILRDDAKFQLAEDDKRVNAAFLFAGMGTAEAALLRKMGINVVQTSELEQPIIDLYNLTHGTAEIPVDILELDPNDLVKKLVKFIHMSPPCQAFSAAREKGTVTPEMYELEMKIARKLAEIITIVKPDNITIENAPAYQDSAQYAVIKEVLNKEGYFIREQTPDAQNYGGNSSRKRLIVQASLTPLKEEPKTNRSGDWYPALEPFLKEAPVDELMQYTGGKEGGLTKNVVNLLNNIASKKYDANVAYVNPGGDGQFRPQGRAGNALTANFIYDPKKRKQGVKEKLRTEDGSLYGSSAVMRVALPVRKLVDELGVKAVAKQYGASVKQINDAYYGTGFLFKRGTTPMYLAYMNLPTDTIMSDNTRLNRAVLGNGIQGVITREFIEPMIGKPQLSDDYINEKLAEIDNNKLNKSKEETKAIIDDINESPLEEVDEDMPIPSQEDFYNGPMYQEEFIRDEERIIGSTKLTHMEIDRLLRAIGLAGLSLPASQRQTTLVANAARDFNLNQVLDLAKQILDSDDMIHTDAQHASFVLAIVKLKNQYELVRTSIEEGKAYSTDVDLPNTMEEILSAMNTILRADAKGGSKAGSALVARRIMVGQDYSVQGVTKRATQTARGTLKDEDLKNVLDAQSKWEDTNKKIQDVIRKETASSSETDVANSKKFIDDNKKQRGKAKKQKLSNKQRLINKMRELGVNIEGFGKNQLADISVDLARNIREMAKILVIEDGYDDLNEIVDVIRGLLPDVSLKDVLGSISGRIQRIPQTPSEAQNTLKRLTLQSDLMVQINNGLDKIFDPLRKQAPKNVEIMALREQLNELKSVARQNANDVQQIERMLTQIEYLQKLIDEVLIKGVRSTDLVPKKEPKKKREDVKAVEQKLFVKRTELKAADKIVLLKQIIEYGEPPVIPGIKREAQSERLDLLRIEIANLEQEIKDEKKRKSDAAKKAQIKADQEARLESLIGQVEGWYRDNVAPRKQAEINDTQKSIKEQQRLIKQQDRIAELSEILRTGVLPEKANRQIKDETEFSETINNLQEELKQQEWYRQIKKAEFEQRRIAQVTAKIEEQRRVIDENDLSDFMTPKEKNEIQSPELKALLTEQRANERIIRKKIQELKPRTKLEQFGDVMSLGRAFMATGDMSGFLKQGFGLAVRHPKLAAEAMSKAIKAFVDPEFAEQVMMGLESQDIQVIREQSGLFFGNLDTGMIDSEEQFSSNALQWIYANTGLYGKTVETVMGASERNMVVFLNLMRAGAFDIYYNANPKATERELKSYAHWINTSSGRGDLGNAEGAIQALSVLAFSPRFAASRFLMPLEAAYKIGKGIRGKEEGDAAVAKEIAKQYLALYGMGAVTFTLAIMAGGSVNLDEPEESDFLKITFGNTKIDIWAGLGPNKRLFSLYMDSIFKQIRGEEVTANIPTKTLNTLVKYKASPWISGSLEAIGGKRYVSGEKITIPEIILERAFPLTASSAYQNWREDATTGEIITEFGGEFFGLGVSIQQPKKKTKSRRLRAL